MFISDFLLNSILIVFAAIFFTAFFYSFIISLKEKEKYAAYRFLRMAFLLALPYLLAFYFENPYSEIIGFILIILPVLFSIFFFLPIKGVKKLKIDTPNSKYDERDIPFSRMKLKEGTDRFNEYYKKRPEYLEGDLNFMSKPGLCAEGTISYNPLVYASTDATFFAVEQFKHQVDGEVATKKPELDPKEITTYLKEWAKHLGVLEVGITELQDYHKYSYGGRTFNYGEEVKLDHKYAIAFTVEMDHYMTATGPLAPTVLESAQQYLNAGTIAIQLSAFLRNLGHESRAHIDGNYQVLCPLVARDAGLGEIGRMGLMMTPKLGPRVRIAVVTTDIPLVTDDVKEDKTMIDFCNKCMKCAEVCPSNSISFEDREMINGVERWEIDATSCFTFWCDNGTDCGKCMSVCPYSHPNNFLHNFIRFGIRNNVYFRRLAIFLDDYFYGKKPLSKPIPKWMDIK